jgi:hypothetical protein
MNFPFGFTSMVLCWLFLTAFPLVYDKFRQDPDATDRQALSAALGVCALLILVTALIFSLLGIRR